jgi:hypothetical protein
MADWALSRLYEAGASGFSTPLRCVVTEGYDPAEPLSALYQIADSALKAQAQAALIVSSRQGTALAIKPAEFFHAVFHVLSSYGIICSWIPEGLTFSLDPFRKVHLDLAEKAE